MQALIFDGQLRLRDVPSPHLLPGEALIEPHLVGLCATDILITRGYKAFHGVLGHEWVGTVVACDDPEWIGQRVVGEINVPCGSCAVCARGDAIHCPERTAMGILGRDGALAERVALPVANLHRVPPSVRDQQAVFVEPLAAALAILDAVHVRPSDRVAVVGDGKLGLLVAQVLQLAGCDLTLVGRHPERWSLIERLQPCGVGEVAAEMQHSYDLVVDCTGNPCGLDTARVLVRPRGTLVLKSTFTDAVPFDLSWLVVDEIRLIGSRCGPFAPALDLLARGMIETDPLVSAIYPFDRVLEAFAAVKGGLKILVEIGNRSHTID